MELNLERHQGEDFKNIKIINNLVFDTYRSAITFAAVDGGFVKILLSTA